MARTGLEIAVVGLACRLPGADGPDELWRNLVEGRESISRFTDAELAASGVPAGLRARPGYVPARGIVEGAERFDAGFFGYSAREAVVLDPQQRLFLECSWAACEDAGWDPDRLGRPVGVYAGVSHNTHMRRLAARGDDGGAAGPLQVLIGNDKDYLATRVAYKLNFRGPALTIQTACSTSLVAVHLACRSLLGGECDAALAGGASLSLPSRVGYLHAPGSILSPDGRCRAFDARGQGTVPGSGVGVVALKRLEDALAAGDPVRAVILGSAVNNDGATKVGFTAPSVEGQARAISEALTVAGVPAETISYVEAHGTGTALGDPVEVAALRAALEKGRRNGGGGPCLLGSVKTNVGHLDAAAGVAGLIKTVLMLEHRRLPPSLHFETPNPRIDFGSRLRVNAEDREWEAPDAPRRAGVSSFGIGGTNVHAVLEEAPAPPPAPLEPERPWRVLPLSARTPEALDRMAERLARHLEDVSPADAPLAAVAHTLRTGRRAFEHRRAVVARDLDEAVRSLRRAGAACGNGEVPPAVADAARRWEAGEAIDAGEPGHGGDGTRRVHLPTYPFDPEFYGIPPAPATAVEAPAPERPESPAEAVERAWTRALGTPPTAGADFFGAGGDSLAALQIVEDLRRALGVEVAVQDLFEAPGFRDLVDRVTDRGAGRGDRGGAAAADDGGAASASAAGRHVLSYQQERLLRQARRGELGNESYVLEMRGDLSRSALRRALARVVARHEILRTLYPGAGREGVQRVLPEVAPELRRIDLDALPPARRRAEAARVARSEAALPFDPETPPHLRGLLIALGPGRFELAITHHPVVADGGGMGVFFSDLERLYAGSPSAGEAPRYTAYAARQRERSESAESEADLAYWRERLAGLAPRPSVPAGSRPAERAEARLPPDLAEGLARIGRRHRATLFMTVLCGWSLALARALGREEVVIAAPVSGREGPSTRSLLGYTAGLLPLRIDTGDAAGGPEARLDRVRGIVLDAFAHQAVPYERLVGLATGGADGDLFDAALVAQRSGDRVLRLPGVEVAPPRSALGGSAFRRALYLSESRDGAWLTILRRRDPEREPEAEGQPAEALLEAVLRELRSLAAAPSRGGDR